MKYFNCICMVALLTYGTYCTSSICTEPSGLTENYNETINIDPSTDTLEQSTHDKCNCVNENIPDDIEEITSEASVSDPSDPNETTEVTQIITEQPHTIGDDLDAMVDDLVQSGAVEDDITVIEAQPKWKLLLTRAGSYALSMSITCKQLVVNAYTQVKTTVVDYWSNKKNA